MPAITPWDRSTSSCRRCFPPTRRHAPVSAFGAGFRAAWLSVLAYVVIGTYVGIGALTHDFGFGLAWAVASTALVWAGPAQV